MTAPPLARRIYEEHRRIILPLAVLLGLALVLLAVVLFPLAGRVQAADARAADAAARVEHARAQEIQAKNTLEGKTRATAELSRFYGQVLPTSRAEARRITYLRLDQMASEANLRPDRRRYSPESERGSRLERLDLDIVVSGDYRNIRRFIHMLETAPEFLVIRNVQLTQRDEPGSPLALSLALSTFYQADHGR